MRSVFAILGVLVATSAFAHDSVRLKALDEKVEALQERVANLETSTAPAVARVSDEQRVDGQRMKARERMRKDSSIYSNEQLREIEALYQVANQKWQTQEGKDSLKQLIQLFDKANRTGCALLYLGQMSKGREREEYLQRAASESIGD